QRCQVYGAEEGTAVAGLEDVPAQSCGWYRGDGLVRGADHLLRASLRVADHGPRPTTSPVGRRYSTPNSGMDCQSTDGGMRLGANPSLSDPRSGCLLRQHIRPTRSLSGHSRSSDVSPLALAERICGTIDRLDPPRMPRPRRGGWRATSAACVVVLYRLLQRRPNASFIRQGCAGSKDRSALRAHRSAANQIAPQHVMASGSLPSGFPATEIE